MQFSCHLSFPGAAPPASYYSISSTVQRHSISYLFLCSSTWSLICGGPPLMRAIIGPQANTPERNILQVIRHSNFRPTDSKKYIFPDWNFTHFLLTLFSTFSFLSRSFLMLTPLILPFYTLNFLCTSQFYTLSLSLLLIFLLFSFPFFSIPFTLNFITFSPLFNF